jgi:hypothetical protein
MSWSILNTIPASVGVVEEKLEKTSKHAVPQLKFEQGTS